MIYRWHSRKYVRDIIKPDESFDPTSSISIARAVKRFMKVDEDALNLFTAEQFLNRILLY